MSQFAPTLRSLTTLLAVALGLLPSILKFGRFAVGDCGGLISLSGEKSFRGDAILLGVMWHLLTGEQDTLLLGDLYVSAVKLHLEDGDDRRLEMDEDRLRETD